MRAFMFLSFVFCRCVVLVGSRVRMSFPLSGCSVPVCRVLPARTADSAGFLSAIITVFAVQMRWADETRGFVVAERR
jgi:hypothetical protein